MRKDYVVKRDDGWHIVHVFDDGSEMDSGNVLPTREAAEKWRTHIQKIAMLLNAGAEIETVEQGGRLYAKFKHRVDN